LSIDKKIIVLSENAALIAMPLVYPRLFFAPAEKQIALQDTKAFCYFLAPKSKNIKKLSSIFK